MKFSPLILSSILHIGALAVQLPDTMSSEDCVGSGNNLIIMLRRLQRDLFRPTTGPRIMDPRASTWLDEEPLYDAILAASGVDFPLQKAGSDAFDPNSEDSGLKDVVPRLKKVVKDMKEIKKLSDSQHGSNERMLTGEGSEVRRLLDEATQALSTAEHVFAPGVCAFKIKSG